MSNCCCNNNNCCSGQKNISEKTVWDGEPAVRIRAGGYEALIVASVSANLIELKDTVRGLDLMRTPANAVTFKGRPAVFGIPVLFYPNRIEDGTFKFGDRVYNLPINNKAENNHLHGFLYTRPWEITRTEVTSDGKAEAELTFKADKNHEIYQYLPHEFTFKLTYRLSKNGLEQEAEVLNQSNEPLPFGLGYHTAFKIPFNDKAKAEDYSMMAGVGEKWELGARTLPTGNKLQLNEYEAKLNKEGIPPLGSPIGNLYDAVKMQKDGQPFHGAILKDSANKVQLVYKTDKKYGYWVIWNNDANSGFVCIEPQTWITNAPNVKLPANETGFRTLQPGEVWKGKTEIYIEDIK